MNQFHNLYFTLLNVTYWLLHRHNCSIAYNHVLSQFVGVSSNHCIPFNGWQHPTPSLPPISHHPQYTLSGQLWLIKVELIRAWLYSRRIYKYLGVSPTVKRSPCPRNTYHISLVVSPDLLKAKGKALGNLGGLYEEKTTNMERVPIICWQPVTYNLQLHVISSISNIILNSKIFC